MVFAVCLQHFPCSCYRILHLKRSTFGDARLHSWSFVPSLYSMHPLSSFMNTDSSVFVPLHFFVTPLLAVSSPCMFSRVWKSVSSKNDAVKSLYSQYK